MASRVDWLSKIRQIGQLRDGFGRRASFFPAQESEIPTSVTSGLTTLPAIWKGSNGSYILVPGGALPGQKSLILNGAQILADLHPIDFKSLSFSKINPLSLMLLMDIA
mmetsp:Transcript_6524/g.10134  ORF Transcript_6524/g.10134 Transcript_6524/m.10134 type:complete len:108 (-) Transcript_6524:260-583(-)|eukprot:CAMPEP_0184668602 /NCGR_PEP_ID=MMETSP0308-20130426/73086_1 /TAXON_ID=38269 /ORGANISM="Gloeochaete witrockiana, Strain SAG 46.84" /LENGTH=107 /DNA_ID=CAMNT_0027114403 /DNA_START=136 /DNA_END=459 /DNA_ORIENTATION=-